MQHFLISLRRLENHLVPVCSGCENLRGLHSQLKYRRPYAIAVVTDSMLYMVVAIWQGCRHFEYAHNITAQRVGGLSASIVYNRVQ